MQCRLSQEVQIPIKNAKQVKLILLKHVGNHLKYLRQKTQKGTKQNEQNKNKFIRFK